MLRRLAYKQEATTVGVTLARAEKGKSIVKPNSARSLAAHRVVDADYMEKIVRDL